MFFVISNLAFYALIAYFLWYKILIPYYRFWYYYKQNIPYTGFPLPIIGDLISYIKALKKCNFGKDMYPP
jgi:hypothetical protein